MRHLRCPAQLKQDQARAAAAPPVHSIHTIVVQYGSAHLQEVRPAPPYAGPVAYLVDGCAVSQAAFAEAMDAEPY